VTYRSSHEAARKLGLNPGSISACLNGRIKQTGGYEFERDEEAAEPDLLPGEEWCDVVRRGGSGRRSRVRVAVVG